MTEFRGKSVQAMVRDIADGYVSVNPIFLKPFGEEGLKTLYQQVHKIQAEIRSTPFPTSDVEMIRQRNLKLQRLHGAAIVTKHFARTRRIQII